MKGRSMPCPQFSAILSRLPAPIEFIPRQRYGTNVAHEGAEPHAGQRGDVREDAMQVGLARFGFIQHVRPTAAEPVPGLGVRLVPLALLLEDPIPQRDPRDTKDYPAGVWTLPPTLRLKDTDRARFLAIGESDRATLKFVKP